MSASLLIDEPKAPRLRHCVREALAAGGASDVAKRTCFALVGKRRLDPAKIEVPVIEEIITTLSQWDGPAARWKRTALRTALRTAEERSKPQQLTLPNLSPA